MSLPDKTPLFGEVRNLPGYVINKSPQRDATLSYISIHGKPDNFSGNHINLFLKSVHNYTDIYDGIYTSWPLKGAVVLERGIYSISISS